MFRCFVVICNVLILTIVCAATQKNEAQDLDKTEIQQFLQHYQDAWNEHDVDQFLELWHDDAKIMTGMRRIVSKMEYKYVLPKRFRKYPSMKIVGYPDIIVSANKATVQFYSTYPPIITGKTQEVLIMQKENGRWLIIENKY